MSFFYRKYGRRCLCKYDERVGDNNAHATRRDGLHDCQTPASSSNSKVDDMKYEIMTIVGAALLAGTATAAPLPLQDRIAELCSVSNTDVEGQRLAKACRAEVRARHRAEQLAEGRPRPLRTAEVAEARPR
jgi:hypothetical protein